MIPPSLNAALAAATPAVPPLIDSAGPGAAYIDGQRFINLASCDYLGLARHPEVLEAATDALQTWGLGSAATRILSGGTRIHRQLEHRLANFVGGEDAVLHGSCWTANAAVFGTLGEMASRSDTTLAVFSDRLNHASLIDAIRTVRPRVSHLVTYDHDDTGIDRLREQLRADTSGGCRVIVTDGVFSMEGDQAPLRSLVDLATEFEALLVVDDSHGTGVLGERGRGSFEAQDVFGEIDVITSTLGKALGGAVGGFVAGSRAFTTALRAVSRPYIFSNNPPYPVVAATLAALDVLERDTSLLMTMRSRIQQLRAGVQDLGLETLPGEHPIVPLMLGSEELAQSVSRQLLDTYIYATPMAFPVVPRGEARIRMQVSAAHSSLDIQDVIAALAVVQL